MELATLDHVEELDTLAQRVIKHMNESQIPQWNLSYPRKEHFIQDITKKALYIHKQDNNIIGALTILPENDLPYKDINCWIKTYSLVIHRVLVDPNMQDQGIGSTLFLFVKKFAKNNHYESIKIDTHIENYKMRQFLKKQNFMEHDYLPSINRLAYEYVLEDM